MMVNTMANETLEAQSEIIDSLYPTFDEYADNSKFHYWMEYACELDMVMHHYNEDLIEHINTRLLKLRAGSAEHDACVDVASTLEETIPKQFKGVFKYD